MKMGEVKESKLGMEMYLTKVNIGTYVFMNMFKILYITHVGKCIIALIANMLSCLFVSIRRRWKSLWQ